MENVEISGMTREAFILRGALAAGTVYGTATVGPFVATAIAQSAAGDIGILNFALTLEYLEAGFYDKGRTLSLSRKAKKLVDELYGHESQHVEALTAAVKQLGGRPAKRPRFTFPISDQASFLALAQTLEDTGVSAYNGVAPAIESQEILAAAAGIVQVEARHAAAIRLLRGQAPAPNAFDKVLSKAQVLTAVKPLIKT
jgi:rubrerythrin